MALSATRLSNAPRLNTTYLYTQPYRTAIVVLQSLLLLFAFLAFVLTITFIYDATYGNRYHLPSYICSSAPY